MVRGILICVVCCSPVAADTEAAARALKMNQAMREARALVEANKPGEAVATLEAVLMAADGNPRFLDQLRAAYVAYALQLEAGTDTAAKAHIARQLKTLGAAAPPQPPAPLSPTSQPPTPLSPPSQPPTPLRTPVVRGMIPAPEGDPFAQTPLDDAAPDVRKRATQAFRDRRYLEASRLFAEVREPLSADESQAFAYCRLFALAEELKGSSRSIRDRSVLEKEAQDAMRQGGVRVQEFGQHILDDLRKQPETTATAGDWQTLDTANFRIFHRNAELLARSLAREAEAVRTACYEKWAGPPGTEWTPRCDLVLHTSAEDYARSTGKAATLTGHASVGMRGEAIVGRRIDVRRDDATILEVSLPREIGYVVLADLFRDQPLPRWADVGMTVHGAPVAERARYLRMLPGLVSERKLIPLAQLVEMKDFPDATKMTAFYVESVSFVEFLVKRKGPKAFTLYLREAPRRGYEESLRKHYGFRDAADAQEQWLAK